MATGGAKVSSDIVQDLSEISDVVNDLNEENSDCLVATHIELTDKGKIKWNGPYEMLQKLMVKLTGEDVLWSTPGGDCKMLKLNEVEVRWYTSNKSLTINGIKKEDLKSQLRVLATLVKEGEASGDCLGESQSIGSSNTETLIDVVRNLEKRVNIELNNFRGEIRDLKTNSQLRQTGREKNNIHDSDSNQSLLAMREFLLKENANLKERNEKLNSDLNNYKCMTSDLNMRVKELENQNSSLVTVINLLNKEQGNDGNKEQRKTANNRRRSRVECRDNNIYDDVVEVVPLENRYASLTKYSNVPLNQSETFFNESNQHQQQKQAQRQVQDRSQQQAEQQDPEQQHQHQQPRRPRQNNRRDRNRQAQVSQIGEQKRRIDIVGDSMLKGLKGHKMSRTDKVRVTTFSGCSTRDMFDYINPTINRKPDQLIVHVGTNSLRDSPNPTECAGEIIDLANSIKDSLPTTELVLSALITGEVNKILRQHCDKKRWNILEHSNITKRHLNRSGLHLNKVGTTHLACNLIQCIQHGNK